MILCLVCLHLRHTRSGPFSSCDEFAKIVRPQENRSKWSIFVVLYFLSTFFHISVHTLSTLSRHSVFDLYTGQPRTSSIEPYGRHTLVISQNHFTISSIRIVQQISIRAKSTVVYIWHTKRLRYMCSCSAPYCLFTLVFALILPARHSQYVKCEWNHTLA